MRGGLVWLMGCFGVLAAGCAGEPRVLPPRSPPAHVVPRVALSTVAPAAGHARVVLDTTDGPMRVSAVYDPSFVPPGGATGTSRSGELCITPCVVDLPRGRYRLYLSAAAGTDPSSGDTDDVVVDDGVYVYRRAPGLYDTPSPIDSVLPGTVVMLSLTALAVGLVAVGSDGGEMPGLVLIGAGIGGSVGGGVWLYNSSRAVRQEGATSLWQMGN